MNKLKRVHKIILLWIAMLMAAGTVTSAKSNESGSIRIALSDGKEGTEKNGVVFGYAKVADIVNGEYKKVEKYSGEIDFNQIDTAVELEEAAARMKTYVKIPDGKVETDESGVAEIRNLKIGVYLVYAADQAKYEIIRPFLVAVPTWDERSGEMDFHINVIPKHEAVPENKPIAPQTNLDSNYKNLLAISICFIIAGMVFLIFSVRERRPFQKAEMIDRVLKETVVSGIGGTKEIHPFDRKIKFDSLRQINQDIAAWIYVPGTKIDYPVLIGKDDSKYLKKNFRGEKSELGSIFGFSDTSKDFSDAHICLFGHNMRRAQMFGELKQYKERQFTENHQKLYIYTPEGVTEYQLFSVYECEKTDKTFEHRMSMNSEEFLELFERINQKNILKMKGKLDVRIPAEDKQIITLSCCSEYRRTVNRMTVHFLETEQIKTDLHNR